MRKVYRLILLILAAAFLSLMPKMKAEAAGTYDTATYAYGYSVISQAYIIVGDTTWNNCTFTKRGTFYADMGYIAVGENGGPNINLWAAKYPWARNYYTPGKIRGEDMVTFNNCTFKDVLIENHFPITFNNCTFDNCRISNNGGREIWMNGCTWTGGGTGGYVGNGTIGMYARLHIDNCTFAGDTRIKNPLIGTVSNVWLSDCGVTITGNTVISGYTTAINIEDGGGQSDVCYVHSGDFHDNGTFIRNGYYSGTVNILGGDIHDNTYGIKNDAGTVNLSEGKTRANSYALYNSWIANLSGTEVCENGVGIYQNGTLNIKESGHVKNHGDGTNDIFLAAGRIINIAGEVNTEGEGALGEIDLAPGDRIIGRVLYSAFDSNASLYHERFTLNSAIFAIDPSDSSSHKACIRPGNGVNNSSVGNGILSGIFMAVYDPSFTGRMKDKYSCRILNGEEEASPPEETFIWKEDDSFDTDTFRPIAEYENGTEVPYMKFRGWALDAHETDNEKIYGPGEEKALRQAADLSSDFIWYAVWDVNVVAEFDGNHNFDSKGNPMIDEEHLPEGAILKPDKTGFRIENYTGEEVLPEYVFGRQDKSNKYIEYSQQGWSILPEALYEDGKNVRYDSPDKYAGLNDIFCPEGEALTGIDNEAPKFKVMDELLDYAVEHGLLKTETGPEGDEIFILPIYAVYDMSPDIVADDRYFTSDEVEAMTPEEMETELLKYKDEDDDGDTVIYIDACDREDGYYENSDEDRISVAILDFDYEEYRNIGDQSDMSSPDIGGTSVTYEAVDKVGNKSYCTVMVYVESSHDIRSRDKKHESLYGTLEGYVPGQAGNLYVRFIDEWNYKKNPYWDRALTDGSLTYTDSEFAHAWNAYLNGADMPYSKWYTDPDLVRLLTDGFETLRTAGGYEEYADSYTLFGKDIEAVEDYIKTHGIGNTKEDNALDGLYAFISGKRTDSELHIRNDGMMRSYVQAKEREEKERPDGIYTMDYPEEWRKKDPWQQGRYIKR
ncbi:MAG: hypothetical protein K6A69_09470 [Lachnospiraceae bacterium]|nr:hypothetical protein [Lachnospiraceae bacterium]